VDKAAEQVAAEQAAADQAAAEKAAADQAAAEQAAADKAAAEQAAAEQQAAGAEPESEPEPGPLTRWIQNNLPVAMVEPVTRTFVAPYQTVRVECESEAQIEAAVANCAALTELNRWADGEGLTVLDQAPEAQ
jgi:hypothetical protein